MYYYFMLNNFRNILCIPIKDEKEVVGIAQLCNKLNGLHFNAFDEEIAVAFSIYCGISIIHSLMYKKVQDAQQRSKLSNELMMYHMKVTHIDVTEVKYNACVEMIKLNGKIKRCNVYCINNCYAYIHDYMMWNLNLHTVLGISFNTYCIIGPYLMILFMLIWIIWIVYLNFQVQTEDVKGLVENSLPELPPDFSCFTFAPRHIPDDDTCGVVIGMFDDLGLCYRWRINREVLARFVWHFFFFFLDLIIKVGVNFMLIALMVWS